MKKIVLLSAAVILSLGFSASLAAQDGACGSKARAKKAKPCCSHEQAAQDARKALDQDYDRLDRAMAPAEQEAFLKRHRAHLEAYLAAKNACAAICSAPASGEKRDSCGAKGGRRGGEDESKAGKGCPAVCAKSFSGKA